MTRSSPTPISRGDGRPLVLPAHIHASIDRKDVEAWVADPKAPVQRDGTRLEIIIDARSEDEWILKADPRVVLPLRDAIGHTAWGVPTAAMEVLLFYKATAYFGIEGQWRRLQDDADFVALEPLMEPAQRQWLRDAVARVIPGHPWLEKLT